MLYILLGKGKVMKVGQSQVFNSVKTLLVNICFCLLVLSLSSMADHHV